MKLGVPGLGKSKKQGSRNLTVETTNGLPVAPPSQAVAESRNVAKTTTPKTPKTPKEEKQGFVARITSRASLRRKKSNAEKLKNGTTAVPAAAAALPVSKSEQELKRAFRVYDSDNDGGISIAELRTVLTSLGGAISDDELTQLMKQIDTDNDGFISLDEFVQFHRVTTTALSPAAAAGEVSPVHDPIKDAFQMFDKDGDNRISAAELQSVLVSLGDKGHSLEECKKMIQSVDKDGDGYVDFLEFQELMRGHD